MTKYGLLYHVTNFQALFGDSRRLAFSYCLFIIHSFANKMFCAGQCCLFYTYILWKTISLLNFREK